MSIVKFYPNSCFKVEYIVNEMAIDFKAWEIIVLDLENIEESEIDEERVVVSGFINSNGCCEFEYSAHICSIHGIERFLQLMKDVYKTKGVYLY